MPAITLSGFNNIDFKSIIDIIIQSERQPIDTLTANQKTEQSRLSAYGSLNSALSTLQSSLDALKASSAYGDLQASSSDQTTVSASASSTASKGTFSINVTSLARPQVTASAERQFSDINAAVIDGGSFSITQSGTTTNIDLTGVSSLAELRDAINNQQTGVRAAIINDGSSADSPAKPFRLVLSSATAGVSNAFTVNDQTSLGGGTAGSVLNLSTDPTNGTARDTEFTYNGITVRSTSTSVSDAIPGLSLNLYKTGTAVVTVSDDNSSLSTKLHAVVDAFNKFNDFAQGQFKVNTSTSSTRPPLASDPLLRGLNRQIRNYFTSQSGSGAIQDFSSLGIRFNQSGKLEIDDSALQDALDNHKSDVAAFLSGSNGFGAKISDFLKSYTQAGGAIDNIDDRIQKTIDNYGARIATMESQLTLREDQLTKQFAAADQAISQLNSQAGALNSLGSQYRLF